MSSLTLSDVSLRWDDGPPLFTELSFTPGPGRTGLVARNGTGKSALLRLIAGELTPSSGSIVVDGTVGYLPQTLPMLDDRSVAELLGVAVVIDAQHSCMTARGVRTPGVGMVTSRMMGVFRDDERSREEVLGLMGH